MRIRLKHRRLAELIAASALTQNHWAIRLGLSRGHWSGLVNGNHPFPSAKTRTRILESFEVPFDELFEIDRAGDAWVDGDFRRAISERYVVDAEVGQGGMGAVYLARDIRHGRLVAIKVIAPEAVSGIGLTQFQREISTVAQLLHPNILSLYESGDVAGQPYFVMPYVREGSLRVHLSANGRLSVAETIGLMRGVADALDYAHAERVLHCDIKPENILLRRKHAWLTDFGIARRLHAEVEEWPRRQGLDTSAGTPAYVSPEQASGDPHLDARSDVYSLGCVVYEMLAGRSPFEGGNTQQIVSRRFIEPPPPLRDFAPDVPPDVEIVIARAMALARDRRYESAAAFINALADAARPATIIGRASRTVWRGVDGAQRALKVLPRHPIGGLVRAFVDDLRYVARSLGRTRGVFAAIVGTLALGIGANATMFGVLDKLMLRPPSHVRAPDSLSLVALQLRIQGSLVRQTALSYPMVQDLERNTDGAADIAAFASSSVIGIGRGADAQRMRVQLVTGGFFATLGAAPVLGRFFTRTEDQMPSGEPVAVIGYGFWKRHFNSSRDVLGRTLPMGRRVFTIIGVAPKDFAGVGLTAIDAWVPITAGDGLRLFDSSRWYDARDMSWLRIIVRRSAGDDSAQSAQRVGRTLRSSMVAANARDSNAAFDLVPVLRRQSGAQSANGRVARLLTGVAFLVLLISCANVANLLLARGVRRRQEIAVRVALGASRARLVRLMLAESFVLAACGGVGALLVARWGGAVVRRQLLGGLGIWEDSLLDWRVLMFTAVATLTTAALIGLIPALRGSRVDLNEVLKAGGRGGGGDRSRVRVALLVAQATFSVVLLFGTGMFVRSLQNVNRIALGMDANDIALVSADLTAAGYVGNDIAPVFDDLAARARQIPQVVSASVSVAVPLSSNIGIGLRVPGRDSVPRSANGTPPVFDAVDAEYFVTMGVAIVRGRAFADADIRAGTPVTIVNEEMARRTWPNEDAIGKCLQIGGDARPCSAVIGVARNTHRQSLFEEAVPLQFYAPIGTEGVSHRDKRTLFVRMRTNDAAARNAVRAALQTAVPNLPYVSVSPMRDLLSTDVRAWEMGSTMFAAFAGAALFLVAIGWYASLGYEVDQRRREVGIRLALGALPGSVLRAFVWRGTSITLIGLVAGVGVVAVALRWIREFLYDVSPADPVVCIAVASTLVLTTFVATYLPARRAARTDAATTLREE